MEYVVTDSLETVELSEAVESSGAVESSRTMELSRTVESSFTGESTENEDQNPLGCSPLSLNIPFCLANFSLLFQYICSEWYPAYNLYFRIKLIPSGKPSKNFDICIQCKGDSGERDLWRCFTRGRVSLVSLKKGQKDVSFYFQQELQHDMPEIVCDNFFPEHEGDLINPETGFIKNDAIELAVTLLVDPPTTIDSFPSLSPTKRPSWIQHDLGITDSCRGNQVQTLSTVNFSLRNFSKLNAPRKYNFFVQNLPLKIEISKTSNNGGECFGFEVSIRNIPQGLSYRSTWTAQVLSAKQERAESIIVTKTYSSRNFCTGFPLSIPLAELKDRENGFVRNDNIEIQIILLVDPCYDSNCNVDLEQNTTNAIIDLKNPLTKLYVDLNATVDLNEDSRDNETDSNSGHGEIKDVKRSAREIDGGEPRQADKVPIYDCAGEGSLELNAQEDQEELKENWDTRFDSCLYYRMMPQRLSGEIDDQTNSRSDQIREVNKGDQMLNISRKIRTADKKDQESMHLVDERLQKIDDPNLFNEHKFANEEHLDQKHTLTSPFEKEDQANAFSDPAEGYTDLRKEFLDEGLIAAINRLRMTDELNKKRMALEGDDQAKYDDYLARKNEKTLQLMIDHLQQVENKISHAQGQYLELVQTIKGLYGRLSGGQNKLHIQQRSLRFFKRDLNTRVKQMMADHAKIVLEFQAEKDRLYNGIVVIKKLEKELMDYLLHLSEMSRASTESRLTDAASNAIGVTEAAEHDIIGQTISDTSESEGSDEENSSLSGWSLVNEPERDTVATSLSSSFLEEKKRQKTYSLMMLVTLRFSG